MPLILLHHSETIDPTLVRWMRELMLHIFDFGAWPVIIFLGAVIVVIPIWLMVSSARRRRPVEGIEERELQQQD